MNKQQEMLLRVEVDYQKRLVLEKMIMLEHELEKIKRVRELHAQDGYYCAVCYNKSGTYSSSTRMVYPCPTIETLDGE